MAYNLLEEKWIPVRTADGSRRKVAPWEITSIDHGGPIVAIDSPRADFNGALMQFLIGLVQTSELIPKREPEWSRGYRSPPTDAALRDAFLVHKDVFFLDGDGPRFLQDLKLENGTPWPISDLLIELSGNGHFTKSKKGNGFCFCCAAIALFCLQTNAPEGGRGHLTGLRGGGPLTTLVLPPEQDLWKTIWLNIIPEEVLISMGAGDDSPDIKDIFPWMAPTRTGEKNTGTATLPGDAHPLQMYWSMPRRIRIDFNELATGACDVCGEESESLVQGYFARPHGVKYEGPWVHPLTPYRFDSNNVPISQKARAGSLNYRSWVGLVIRSTDADEKSKVQSQPARVVEKFTKRSREVAGKRTGAHLWGFGYDMEHMRARCWFEGRMPMHAISDERTAEKYTLNSERMVRAAITIGGFLSLCLRQAWFGERDKVRGDTGFVGEAFWSRSEHLFFLHLDKLIRELETSDRDRSLPTETLKSWHRVLCKLSLELFDVYVTSGPIENSNPARIARARNRLRFWPHGKKVKRDILALPDEPKKSSVSQVEITRS
ncbi:type I-E CRISPR-associated protein Cse1/CasA [Desulfomonile tiedjei]|uniref:CRISPR-associated protein, Cse1 family n=1 Tax=Desulfomonile tiedjei (strain ATCC 49306 / DSM 6799 / DCB-1) TaxID=706587 RepID=I4CC91_DESTA|nr:type I-E CRISPR-associated protein Cse1/CasA [Desulfomonile tiedjei]AFM27182.1 CRISPR-associated protein, Cse1 family [Desulfomonile tiedjei DSM 6799]